MSRPNIIFCNLQNSGSSAVDPILRDILVRSGYFRTPYGPEGTHRLRDELLRGELSLPFYHWSHDSLETFQGMVGDPSYRFIYLHRDPRDAAVSWAHDFQHREFFGDMPFSQILEHVVTHVIPQPVKSAAEWIKADCMVITFLQVKGDIRKLIRGILDYVGYFDANNEHVLTDEEIELVIEKYSFESMTGRARGEDGPLLRTGYMLRKGISGEWRQHFDSSLIRRCNEIMGQEILALGYDLSEAENVQDSCADNGKDTGSVVA